MACEDECAFKVLKWYLEKLQCVSYSPDKAFHMQPLTVQCRDNYMKLFILGFYMGPFSTANYSTFLRAGTINAGTLNGSTRKYLTHFDLWQ